MFRRIVLTAFLAFSPSFAAAQQTPTIAVSGAQQVVFDWTTERCEDIDIPDMPARAFRDTAGRTHVIASHYVSRQAVGPTLSTAAHDCALIATSAFNSDPSAYAHYEWVASTYAIGSTVYALIHDEFHGNEVLGMCPSGSYMSCWYNAITPAISTNDGASFTRVESSRVVASVPYKYEGDVGHPYGYFDPSNIVKKDGYYYSFVHAEAYGAQQAGICAMRTATLGDPASWRFWDGTGWTGHYINPYVEPSDPQTHVCARIAFDRIAGMHESVTWNTYFKRWLLIGTSGQYDSKKGRVVYGVYFSLSDDLVTWTQRKLVFEDVPGWNWQCGDPDPLIYPSALDPASSDANYGTTGQSFYIYFTRSHFYGGCIGTLDRDLMRVPVSANGKTGGRTK